MELQGCSSDNSLNSNASLPSVQSHRRHTERRVASWAVCFERLLQDPVGVRYFSVLPQHMTGVGQHIPITDKRRCVRTLYTIHSPVGGVHIVSLIHLRHEARCLLTLCGYYYCYYYLGLIHAILILQEFLKKEFSEENILFWQACEFFSHVPENDKKQVTDVLKYNTYSTSIYTGREEVLISLLFLISSCLLVSLVNQKATLKPTNH